VCCSVLQIRDSVLNMHIVFPLFVGFLRGLLQCVAVRCSVLQCVDCVTVFCSVLQYVAVCCKFVTVR